VFRACLISALILTASANGESEKQPPYQLPLPSGWRKETFKLPPTFAPTMKWKGSEELRFAPGMFKANAPDFFCYAFLLWLTDDAQIDAKTLERELLAYYRGLSASVSKPKKREVDTTTFSLTIMPASQQPQSRPGGEAVAGYSGELKWTEPFATGKHQTLHLEIQTWPSAKHKHHCVFICASPQAPTAAVWKTLRDIRAGCTCR
jgi:hypothetical protein